MPVWNTLNDSEAPLIWKVLFCSLNGRFDIHELLSCKISVLLLTLRILDVDWNMLHYCCISLQSSISAQACTPMHCLCNHFNFTTVSDHLDFPHIKAIYINHFFVQSFCLFYQPQYDFSVVTTDKWLQQWDYLLMCRIKHAHSRSIMRGISFTVRILHAVKCEDDGSDSTHYYLTIYCNSSGILFSDLSSFWALSHC